MFAPLGVLIAGFAGKVIGPQSTAAKVIGWIAVVTLAVILFVAGKAIYDASVIDEHERDVRAELNEDVIEGEQAASAAQRKRDRAFDESQATIQEGMNDAQQNDPDGAAKPVGPVSQSYYDSLRDDQGRKAR